MPDPKPAKRQPRYNWRHALTTRQTLGFSGSKWEVRVIVSGFTLKHDDMGRPQFFPPEVLDEARPLFDGLAVRAYRFGDTFTHLPDEVWSQSGGGLTLHTIGHLRNPRMGEADGVPAMLADVDIIDEAAGAILMAEMDSAHPPELSVDITYRVRAEPDRLLVLKILAAHALDVVSAGAAGGAFLRMVASRHKGVNRMTEIRTVEGLQQAHPELAAALANRAKEPEAKARLEAEGRATEAQAEAKRATESLAAMTKERDELRTKLGDAEKRIAAAEASAKLSAHKAMIETRITESKLDKAAITPTFRRQLEAAQAEDEVKALIEDRESVSRASESVDGHPHPPKKNSTRDELNSLADGIFGDGKKSGGGDIVVKITPEALRQARA